MTEQLSFEKAIIKDCIGFGRIEFSFNLKDKIYEKDSKILLYKPQEKSYLGVLNLNTYETVHIENFLDIINDEKKLKLELDKAVEFLIDGYIKNHEFAEKYNIPIEKLNNKATDILISHYNSLEQVLLNNNNCIKIENNIDNEISNENKIYQIIKELFKLLLTILNNNLSTNEMQGNLA